MNYNCADVNCDTPAVMVTKTKGLNIPLCRAHYAEFRARNAVTASVRQHTRDYRRGGTDLPLLGDFPGFCYVLEFDPHSDMADLVKIGHSSTEARLRKRIESHRGKYPAEFVVSRVYAGGLATEDYCQRTLLDELVDWRGEHELYAYGPEVAAELEALDLAGLRRDDLIP